MKQKKPKTEREKKIQKESLPLGFIRRFVKHQKELSKLIRKESPLNLKNIRYVGGVDVSFKNDIGIGVFVLFSFPDLKMVENAFFKDRTTIPYIPGLLSLRELPFMVGAVFESKIVPDVILVDGNGIAHPRGLGIASHLGLILNISTIGCAKKRLLGYHEKVGEDFGSSSLWTNEYGEVLGFILRTKKGVKPIYISVGHKISLNVAKEIVLRCTKGYRIPEPIRVAHILSKRALCS